MSNYCTITQVGFYAQEFDAIEHRLETTAQDLLVEQASRFFDRLCEVEDNFFAAATGESDKTFYGNGTAFLKLPPYVGTLGADPIVILDNDDNELEVPTYLEQNSFLVIRGGAIRQRHSLYPYTGWPLNMEITVSANWGFEAIPADVTKATIDLAIHSWRTADPAFTAISQSEGPKTLLGVPATVEAVVEKYKALYSSNAVFA